MNHLNSVDAERWEPPSGHESLGFVAIIDQLWGTNVLLVVVDIKFDGLK
jgi:hypothetical protein